MYFEVYNETPSSLKKLFNDNSSVYVEQLKKDNLFFINLYIINYIIPLWSWWRSWSYI